MCDVTVHRLHDVVDIAMTVFASVAVAVGISAEDERSNRCLVRFRLIEIISAIHVVDRQLLRAAIFAIIRLDGELSPIGDRFRFRYFNLADLRETGGLGAALHRNGIFPLATVVIDLHTVAVDGPCLRHLYIEEAL